jgi:long-chain acyl-CoA synthetase
MKRFFRFMEEYKVTGFGMVPASWAMIRKLSDLKIAEYAQQLNYIEIGSAPMMLEEKHTLINILPKTRICMHYGLTEASRSAFMEFHEEKDFLDTIGKQSPNMYIRIMDEAGNEIPDGTEGEICVKGDAVTAGYYKMPEINDVSFWGEYFRTGDWGVRSSDGHIRLCSRKKELINVGGKKVSPLEVEELLIKIDFVDDCACIAIPDPEKVLGEVVKAFIVTRQPELIKKDEINRILSPHLEDYKLPVEYEVTDEIPKTSSGKVQRLLLKK